MRTQLALALALLFVGCATAEAPAGETKRDGRVTAAEHAIERFRDAYNTDAASVVQIMTLDEDFVREWREWMVDQRDTTGRMEGSRLLGADTLRAGATVELRYATVFTVGEMRELFIVRFDGGNPRVAFYMAWWP